MISRETVNGSPATVAYLKKDFTPTDKGKAELVKVIFDSGNVMFGVVPEEQVTEGWVTIHGHHVLIGDENTPTTTSQMSREAPSYPLPMGHIRPDGTVVGTIDHFKNPVTGKWTPEVEARHEADLKAYVPDTMKPTGDKPKATILGGGTGAGKSTTRDLVLGEDPNRLVIDNDKIKLLNPLYEGFKKTNPDVAAAIVHEEASEQVKTFIAEGLRRNLDFVYDSTSSGNGSSRVAKQALDKGYDVSAIFVDAPISVAVERAQKRALDPNAKPEDKDRVVRMNDLLNAHYGSAANFFIMKDNPKLSSVRLYDTSEKAPRLVYERHFGGEEKIYDQKFYDYYQRKAAGEGRTEWENKTT